ncbi:hypothetical protein LDENG_00062290 [Lucifuga dentata]|nr:hypothetical protein LDENG_00062290 [Lucifuga dentata]
MLKVCAVELGMPLQHVFNLSLQLGKVLTDPCINPLQFAHQEKVEDAIIYLPHRAHSQEWCCDFSSAFNTIQPFLLRDKLTEMRVDSHLVTWITGYLTGRPQYVRLKDCSSETVLSPALFTLYLLTSATTLSHATCRSTQATL